MSFGWSVGDLVVAAKFLYNVGQALSETHGAKAQVRDDTEFLNNLKGTLEVVEKAVDEGLISEDIRCKIEAIRNPLLETKCDMASYLKLTEDGTGKLKDIVSRFFKKNMYCQWFSEKIRTLREKVLAPLQGLHMELTMNGLENLQITQETLERWVAESKQVQDDGFLHKVKEWLRPISTVEDTYNSTIRGLVPGTCEWLSSKQEYVGWCNRTQKSNCPLLWISGIPGAGKTNLAAKIIQRLGQDKRTVAYFFCDGTAQRSDMKSILTTLCWELLNQFPEDVELLSEAYYKGGEPTETAMQDCLKQMCKRREPVLLLDGLDECPSRKRKELCGFLVSSPSFSDVVVLSRELEDIQRGLSQAPNGAGIARIKISELDTGGDLKNFILQEAATLDVSDQSTRAQIVRRLQVGSKGMFQWATQMIEHLKTSDCMFDDDFLSRTEEMPIGLHDLYAKILHNIHNGQSEEKVNTSMDILYWMALAQRALSPPEIAMMLRVKKGARRHGTTAMAGQSTLRQTISNYCGSLVRFVQREGIDVVILSHASVKDFLLGRAERKSTVPMSRDSAEVNADLAELCLRYLCFEDIESPPFHLTPGNESRLYLETQFNDYLGKYPLMDYATSNAWYHASISAVVKTVQIAIQIFCSSDAVTIRWLQVFLRLRGDRYIWRSSDATDEISLIETACNTKDQALSVSRWLAHLQGPSHGRFMRWRRFVTSGEANDFLSALHVAAFFDFEEYVNSELERGADPNERNLAGQTPLHLAARGESVSCGKILLDRGTDINARGWAGTTPLSWAVDTEYYVDAGTVGPFEMVHLLLQRGADPSLGPRTRYEHAAPVSWACELPNSDNPHILEMIEQLLDCGALLHNDYPSPREPLLTSAIIAQSPKLLDMLLKRGADPNGRPIKNVEDREHSKISHPLIAALRHAPSVCIVEKLLDFGADPNVVGVHNRRALHLSASSSSKDLSARLTQVLLEKGANRNARSDGGSLPLHEAAKFQNLGAMKALIAKHARQELDSEDDLRRTPLVIAASSDFREGVQALLDAGCALESSLWRVQQVQRTMRLGENAEVRSYEVVEKQAVHFPRDRGDQSLVYGMFRGGAGGPRLPARVVRKVFERAEYWVKSVSERYEAVRVDEEDAKNRIPYILSNPICGARSVPVREIIFITRSHDQGWSDYKHLHGCYEGSMTWFDIVVQRKDGSIRDIGDEGRHVIHNVHASPETRVYFLVLRSIPPERQTPWMNLIEPGDRIGLVPQAAYRGWVNFVESVRIEVLSTFILDQVSGP